jgi:hypothetical protein
MADKRVTEPVTTISLTAACLAIAAAAAVLLLLVSMHVLSPEFNPSWRVVSEYALGHYAWALSSWTLAFTIWSQPRTIAGKIGLFFLIAAGVGETMASVFDIRHSLHGLSGMIGILSLPIAAMLINVSLVRTQAWSVAKKALLWTANLTWMSVVLLVATLIIMTIGYTQAGGKITPEVAIKALPPGVIALVGWANRLLLAHVQHSAC